MDPVVVFVHSSDGLESSVMIREFTSNYVYREDESMFEEDMDLEEDDDSDMDGKSIDYGDEESTEKDTATTLTFDQEEERFINGPEYVSFLEEITVYSNRLEQFQHPEMENALEISRLQELLRVCDLSEGTEEVDAEEDYITSIKFKSGDKAVVISSKVAENKVIKYSQNPMHVSTVQEILKTGNCRNPCDNNPMFEFTLVKIK
jgi:hypothetical protein